MIDILMIPAEWVRQFGFGVVSDEPFEGRRVGDAIHVEGFSFYVGPFGMHFSALGVGGAEPPEETLPGNCRCAHAFEPAT